MQLVLRDAVCILRRHFSTTAALRQPCVPSFSCSAVTSRIAAAPGRSRNRIELRAVVIPVVMRPIDLDANDQGLRF